MHYRSHPLSVCAPVLLVVIVYLIATPECSRYVSSNFMNRSRCGWPVCWRVSFIFFINVLGATNDLLFCFWFWVWIWIIKLYEWLHVLSFFLFFRWEDRKLGHYKYFMDLVSKNVCFRRLLKRMKTILYIAHICNPWPTGKQAALCTVAGIMHKTRLYTWTKLLELKRKQRFYVYSDAL